MTALSPTCNYRCPEKSGTCFPRPCKLYRQPSAEAAARWRLEHCRRTVREGEVELVKRREALRQAEIALTQLTDEGPHHAPDTREATKRVSADATALKDSTPFPSGEKRS